MVSMGIKWASNLTRVEVSVVDISMLEIIQSLAININEGPKRLFFTDLVPIEKKNVQLNEAVRSLILIE